jgi:hypothetical protein
MKIPTPSITRVTANTAEHVNRRIAEQTLHCVSAAAAGGRPAVDARLQELDGEWDIERVIGTAAPVGILVGLGLGLTTGKRRFFALPAAIAGFLIVHGLQGWAPPLPMLRRLGVRTAEEIDEERYALRALRGDFSGLPAPGATFEPAHVERVMNAVRHSPA